MLDKSFENDISELVDSFKSLNDMAYIQYKPEVDRYINLLDNGNKIEENELCFFLDYLLDFCGNERILTLYKKLLRAMMPKYAGAVNEYIKYYKERYEEEE